MSRLILITLLGALFAGACAGCASQPTGTPRWINSPHTDYPADRFLVGVASGETCDEAVDRAIARLSQQIEVRVNATEQRRSLVGAAALFGESEAPGDSDSFTFETEIRLVTDVMLLGVEIVETRPLTSGSCAARAVLEIDRSIILYDDAVAHRDEVIAAALVRADSARSQWVEYLAVSEALREAFKRDMLAIARSVLVARLKRGQTPPVMVAPTLVNRYEALRDEIDFSVVPIGDCPDVFIDVARTILAQRDLPLEPDYFGSLQIRIGWQAQTAQTYDPRWWATRWRISVTLYDAQGGETIAGAPPRSGSAYGLSERAAYETALTDGVTALTESIAGVLELPGADSPQ